MRYALIVNGVIEEIHDLDDKHRIIKYDGKTYNKPEEEHYLQAGWKMEQMPILQDNQKLGAVIEYDVSFTYEIVEFSIEEAQQLLQSRIHRIDFNARNYIDEFVHSSAGAMIWDKAKQSLPKSMAVKEWVESVWLLYAERKAQLEAGASWDESMVDFSILGEIPYSPLECMAE